MNSPAVTEEGKFTIRGIWIKKKMSNLLFTQHSHHKLQCTLPKCKPDIIYITC